ncbi:MAG TPA: ARMT1-like domain-containing protein [Polyangiaceae bacterium]|nr:ARMT1-like domain-containing protein [Polyangiaceae bacterium]
MRPSPIRTDAANAFAHYSMQVRVPRIARDTLARNPDYPAPVRDALERLAAAIEANAPVPAPLAPAADIPGWRAAHAEHAGETWLATEWFYAELAFYRELGHAARFWETDRDPFGPAKEEEIAGTRPWERLELALALPGARDARLHAILDEVLWANRVDLSYAIAASRGRADDDLLVDDRAAAIRRLVTPGARVHLVADNTGTELALDMALVGAVLEDPAATVTIHLKLEPVFVSDAMPRDVWRLLARMREHGGAARGLADRVAAAFDEGRFALAPDAFWSGPRYLWQAPPHLSEALRAATIVVFKGDANYRRVIGDAMWPGSASFAGATAYVGAPLVALRTMKSDALVGVPDAVCARLDTSDPKWRDEGGYGLIQASG